MKPLFVVRSLRHYWRANAVVVVGVATAVAVLGGALVVGDSVRGTLRDLALSRLGAVDVAVSAPGFFRAALVDDLALDAEFGVRFASAAPIIAVEGFVTDQTTGRRAGRVRVYGVDERFWKLHRVQGRALEARQAFISPGLAGELGTKPEQPILVRVQMPSDVPLESLHGPKDEPGRTVRAGVVAVLPAEELGEFSLSQEQGPVRAVFLPMRWLSEQLEIDDRANMILMAARDGLEPPAGSTSDVLNGIIRRAVNAEDAGLTTTVIDGGGVLSVGAHAGLLDGYRADVVRKAAEAAGLASESVFTYLANAIRIGDREVPYSLVTARERPAAGALTTAPPSPGPPAIVLNTWTARELRAAVGDPVQLDYYVWVEPGRLEMRQADFRYAGAVPIGAGDRDLAPVYEGITDSPSLDDWNPPFPIDLGRVRPVDEAYWDEYRTTPKAFIALGEGQRLWESRHGNVTSIRLTLPPERGSGSTATSDGALRFQGALRRELDPARLGFVLRHVRREALASSGGVTDFGQYFVYFSFFLVASALILAALFFKLGIDERAREVGLLTAAGAREAFVQRSFLTEAAVLAVTGGVVGSLAAPAYAAGIVALLGSWWFDAVGTTALEVHVTPTAIAAGFAGGVAAALVCTWVTLRGLGRLSPRTLIAGNFGSGAGSWESRGRRVPAVLAVAGALLSVTLVGISLGGVIPAGAAFFGAAVLMLVAGLSSAVLFYRRPNTAVIAGGGAAAVIRLGLRNASARPARSVLSISVIASAVFILLAVDVFRKDALADVGPSSGLGGYAFAADSLLPIAHDLGTADGREAVGVGDLGETRIDAFRLRPGDDASCLNLYQPSNPRILGVPQSFIARGRFAFGRTTAADAASRANPWLLLNAPQPDGAVPAIADANSLQYVLHKGVGDVIEIPHATGTVRLRVVAALRDSLFQSEILIGDAQFVRLFPEQEGYRFLLIEASASSSVNVSDTLEDRLASFGVDVVPSGDRLRAFHRVENTYLATFQTLGGLGLLLGTVGLSAVLLRNVVERRRELALLGAVGYQPRHVGTMLFAESGSLLVAGLGVGALAAAVASLPAVVERGGRLPFSLVGGSVVLAVLVAGLLATALSARVATRRALLGALRSE